MDRDVRDVGHTALANDKMDGSIDIAVEEDIQLSSMI